MRVLYHIQEVDGKYFKLHYQEMQRGPKSQRSKNNKMKSVKGKMIYKNGVMMLDCMSAEGYIYTAYTSIYKIGGMRSLSSHWKDAKVVKAHGCHYNVSTVQVYGDPMRLFAFILERERFPNLINRKDPFIIEFNSMHDIKVHETVKIKTYGGDYQRGVLVTEGR